MNLQRLRYDVRERAKLGVRRALLRADLDLGRDPWASRVRRTLTARGIAEVLDVGANVGQYAALLRQAGFTGRVVSVEPLPSALERLTARAAGDPRWDVLAAAVGRAPGRATLHEARNSYSSTLSSPTAALLATDPAAETVTRHEVPVTTVAELVAAHGLTPARLLLKVDTEGHEGEVLDGTGDLLDSVAAVQLELCHVELYAGQLLAPELTARLAAHGLEPWTWEAGRCGDDGRLLLCDTLFVRR
ncbi:FkbM family methyltransferase [Nocardioides gansuensis]|uniref:FkbM family methyltransferase n=1 Tax=Nocardioides gansuensis TaxID=2138300 RepID=UPI0014030AFD|nr:FkbM family methyltransferase [Nocardioides gansuensis]